MKKRRIALAAAALLAGCSSLPLLESGGAAVERAAGLADAPQPAAAPAARSGEPRPAAARPQEMAAQAPAAQEAVQPLPQTQPEQRRRVYSGSLELVVPAPQETAQSVIALVQKAGGYVESSTPELLVLRVPSASFDSVFEDLAGLGEVRSRSVESADVTDQFRDLSRRIEVSERTRGRLYALLGRTTDSEERVRILREIRRLTEEIEGLKASLALLDEQVRLSRITVRLVARMDEPRAGGVVPFGWIARLDPLQPSTGPASQPIPLSPPRDFASFSSGRRLSAESAEGTRLRAGAAANDPRGDTDFWRKALLHHLGPRYRSSQDLAAGDFRGAVFASKDPRPWFYLVALQARQGEIIVVEAFFPDQAARERRLAQVSRALEEASR